MEAALGAIGTLVCRHERVDAAASLFLVLAAQAEPAMAEPAGILKLFLALPVVAAFTAYGAEMAALAIFAAEVIWTVTPADAFVTKAAAVAVVVITAVRVATEVFRAKTASFAPLIRAAVTSDALLAATDLSGFATVASAGVFSRADSSVDGLQFRLAPPRQEAHPVPKPCADRPPLRHYRPCRQTDLSALRGGKLLPPKSASRRRTFYRPCPSSSFPRPSTK